MSPNSAYFEERYYFLELRLKREGLTPPWKKTSICGQISVIDFPVSSTIFSSSISIQEGTPTIERISVLTAYLVSFSNFSSQSGRRAMLQVFFFDGQVLVDSSSWWQKYLRVDAISSFTCWLPPKTRVFPKWKHYQDNEWHTYPACDNLLCSFHWTATLCNEYITFFGGTDDMANHLTENPKVHSTVSPQWSCRAMGATLRMQ